jgi:hypothetical protein
LQETKTHVIKDYSKKIYNERCNTRQGNLVVPKKKLYVTTMLIIKGKNPTWYIDIGATWHMKSPFNFFHIKLEEEKSSCLFGWLHCTSHWRPRICSHYFDSWSKEDHSLCTPCTNSRQKSFICKEVRLGWRWNGYQI